jgi:peptide/nickel transport system substrate-binding protein
MAQPGWFPDWYGNNGRTVIAPLFQTNCSLNTTNYGCYSNAQLDGLIGQAEAAASPSQAAGRWTQADHNVMSNAVIVPLISQRLLMYSSANVMQAGTSAVVYQPNIGGADITNVWLKNG